MFKVSYLHYLLFCAVKYQLQLRETNNIRNDLRRRTVLFIVVIQTWQWTNVQRPNAVTTYFVQIKFRLKMSSLTRVYLVTETICHFREIGVTFTVTTKFKLNPRLMTGSGVTAFSCSQKPSLIKAGFERITTVGPKRCLSGHEENFEAVFLSFNSGFVPIVTVKSM